VRGFSRTCDGPSSFAQRRARERARQLSAMRPEDRQDSRCGSGQIQHASCGPSASSPHARARRHSPCCGPQSGGSRGDSSRASTWEDNRDPAQRRSGKMPC